MPLFFKGNMVVERSDMSVHWVITDINVDKVKIVRDDNRTVSRTVQYSDLLHYREAYWTTDPRKIFPGDVVSKSSNFDKGSTVVKVMGSEVKTSKKTHNLATEGLFVLHYKRNERT